MNKKTAKSIVIMGLSSVIGYLITMFLTSYITENIGIEAYGFVSIARTLVGYGGIVTIALTSFTVRYITIAFHKNDLNEANSYYVSTIDASIMLCVILTVLFTFLVANLERIISIPDYLVWPVKWLFVAVFATFVATTLTTPFSTGFYIKNRLDLSGILKILSYLVEVIILVILFSVFTPSIWFVGLSSLGAALSILFGDYALNKRLVPNFKYDIRHHSNKKISIILGNGLWNSLNQLGNTLNSGLDLLVSNAMLTGIQTGQIAVAKSIGTIFSGLSSVVFQPLQPELLRIYSKDNNELFLNQLKKAMRLCGFFASLAFSGFFALGLSFYTLWLPGQDAVLLHKLTILTVFTYVMDIFLQPIYYVNTLTVKNKIPCFITIVGGLINVAGMFLLIRYTSVGIYSVPITTAIIMFLINVIFNPIYACWCLKIKKTYFYPLILKHLLSTGLMCLAFKGIKLLFVPHSWLGLAFNAVIMIICGAIIYSFILLNRKEKRSLILKIKCRIKND